MDGMPQWPRSMYTVTSTTIREINYAGASVQDLSLIARSFMTSQPAAVAHNTVAGKISLIASRKWKRSMGQTRRQKNSRRTSVTFVRS